MSILWRSWLSVIFILGVVLAILGTLASLQHNAILANLLKQRLQVVSESSASSFRPIIDIGLPLSMLRNARDVLERGKNDRGILAIHVVDDKGSIIHSTRPDHDIRISVELRKTMLLNDSEQWSAETPATLITGTTLRNPSGRLAGSVMVVYDKSSFNAKTDEFAKQLRVAGSITWAVLSALSWGLLRLQLGGAIRGFLHLRAMLQDFSRQDPGAAPPALPDTTRCGFLTDAIPQIYHNLKLANEQYVAALKRLEPAAQLSKAEVDDSPLQYPAQMVKQAADTSIARRIGRQITPSVAGIVLAGVLSLGGYTYKQVLASFEPEQATRLALIGRVASSNIQRAVTLGVPIEKLVGTDKYFDELLLHFPEVSHLSISTEAPTGDSAEAGGTKNASASYLQRSIFAITGGSGPIGQISVEANSHYFALQFRDLLMDLAVVVLVATLLALHAVIVTLSVSTGPFNRLLYLLELQARGDFSARLNTLRHSVLDRSARFLSERTDRLYRLACLSTRDKPAAPPRILRFAYLNDIRLPVFLFGLADALSLSFLPIYTRLVDNPLQWLEIGVVLSLPLAGYLLAITLGSPLVRTLEVRLGSRFLLIAAAAVTVIANLGLYGSATTVELILFRSIAGFGYAIATLACQDYVLDVASRDMRARSLGQFTSTLFGGVFSGAAIGGILADRLGHQAAFAVGAVLVSISGLLVWALLPAKQMRQPLRTSSRGFFRSVLSPLRNRRFTLMVFSLAIPSNVMIQAFIAFLVALQLDAVGASAADIGRVLMLYFLVMLMVVLVAPHVYEGRLSSVHRAQVGAAVAAVGVLAVAIYPSYWMMVAAVVLAGFGQGLMRDPVVSIAMELAETELTDLGVDPVLSSLRVLERLGSILGLLLIALLSTYQGYSVATAVIGFWLILGAVLVATSSASQR